MSVTRDGQTLPWNQGGKPLRMIHDTHHSAGKTRALFKSIGLPDSSGR